MPASFMGQPVRGHGSVPSCPKRGLGSFVAWRLLNKLRMTEFEKGKDELICGSGDKLKWIGDETQY